MTDEEIKAEFLKWWRVYEDDDGIPEDTAFLIFKKGFESGFDNGKYE